MLSFLYTLISHPIIPAFLVANLAIGFWAHRKAKANSFEDYALASRSLPTGVLVMTLLGTVIALGTLTRTGTLFYYGLLGLTSTFGPLIGFFFVGTFLAPCLVYFNSAITIGDLMHRFYGRFIHLLTGIIECVTCLLMISAQISAIGAISEYLLGISYVTAMLWFGGLMVIYSTLGGMRSVSYTDIIQVIAALAVLGWIAQIAIQKIGGGQVLFSRLMKEHPQKLTFFSHPQFAYRVKSSLFWSQFCLGALLSPPIVQRMLATQDKRQVRRMWYISAFFYALVCAMVLLIGLSMIVGEGTNGIFVKAEYLKIFQKRVGAKVTAATFSDLLPYLIKHLFKQPWQVDLIFLGIMGILISTVDSFLHAVGVVFVQDIFVPIRGLCGFKELRPKVKQRYAKVGVGLIGIWAIIVGCTQGSASSWLTDGFYELAGLLYILVIIPLIIGIIGIKTDSIAWVSFCSVYFLMMVGLHSGMGIHKYDSFIIAVLLATLAYFLTHIIRNRGIVTLKRSELTVAERLWLPSWSGFRKKAMAFVKAPLHLPTLADRNVVSTPMHPLTFSMLIFGLYTLSSVFASGSGEGAATFMAGIHFVGITLCCGLMLQGIWPAGLKPYFPLYWFVCLFYCLPLGGTLTFFFMHGNSFDSILWIASFVVLAFLVDSTSFCILSFLGTLSSMGIWHLFFGSPPIQSYNETLIVAIGALAVLIVSIFLFGRSKEAHTNERLYWNRIASSILGHDLRGSTQMLGGAGDILEKTFEIGEPSSNNKGEKGYWLPFAQSQFLAQFSTDMSKKAASTRKEISNFLSFIQSQIMGTFEQEAVSMRAMAEEGMEKTDAKVKSSRVKLVLNAKKDFEAKVLAGIFPNVIGNLLMNATTHGKASEITVTVDGDTRTLTVRDNGAGIPSDVLPRIFDLSYSTAAGKRKDNAGVGLAFVKMVLDTSGAKIACHSRTGKGSFTEFVMTFAQA